MDCFVCLDRIKEISDCIKWKSTTWNDLNVQNIVEKHLWSLTLFQTETLWLCLTCWDILKEFHKFYTRIEVSHINLENAIKCENVNATKQNFTESAIYNDCYFSESQDEQEIEIVDEKSNGIKYESSDNENEISLIEIINKGIINSSLDDDINKKRESLEDPLEKAKNSKIKQSTINSIGDQNLNEIEIEASVNEDCDSNFKNDEKELEEEKDDDDEMPLLHRLKVCKKRKNQKPLKEPNKFVKTTEWKNKRKTKITNNNLPNELKCVESLEMEKYSKNTENLLPNQLDGLLQLNNNKTTTIHSTTTTTLTTNFFYQSSISCSQYNYFIAEHCKIECHECHQMQFHSYPEFQEHFRENHKGRPYLMCCETKFYDRSLLVDHINLHKNPEYFKCKHCSKILPSRRNFNIHMRCHNKPLSCDVCGKKFERKCFLNYHRQTHMSAEEKTIPCPDCGKFFASQYLLKNHRRVIHLRKYAKLCNICGQSLLNLESFKRHMKLHEDKSSPPSLSCELCGLLVSSERYLKAHMKSKHPVGGNTEKVCPICRKVLQNADSLRHHVRRNHNTGYIHKCKICEKAFKRIDHLKAHMNIHTGSDKSKCPWCPRTFNANSSMHHHRKKAHPKEWEEARKKKYIGNDK